MAQRKGRGEIDRLKWTVRRNFTAYGLRVGLQVNDPAALEFVFPRLPFGWQPAEIDEVDVLYSLYLAPPIPSRDQPEEHLLFCESNLLAHTRELALLLTTFEKHAELFTVSQATDVLFVHAGAVGWLGGAIVIPGRSRSGKTTLVKALIEAGGTYYSDEFAVLDKAGRVNPYAVPLSIRREKGKPGRKTTVDLFGGQVGAVPFPVRLIIITEYEPKAVWRPQRLTSGQALLALMDNAVAAQGNPAHSMPILKQAVTSAVTLKGKRGEAKELAARLLSHLVITPEVRGS